jgi:hypothetical protein
MSPGRARCSGLQSAASPSPREPDDDELTEAIVAVHNESNGTYGVPRAHAELASQERCLNLFVVRASDGYGSAWR